MELPKSQGQQSMRWKRVIDPFKEERLMRLYWQYRFEPVWSMTARDTVTGWWRRWLNMSGPLRCWHHNGFVILLEVVISTSIQPEPFAIEPSFHELGKYQFATRHGKGYYTESVPDLDEPDLIERVNVELGKLTSCNLKVACTSRLAKLCRSATDNSVWRIRPPFNDGNNPFLGFLGADS